MIHKPDNELIKEIKDIVKSLCPNLNSEERKIEEQRFLDYLNIVWDIYIDSKKGCEDF